MQPDATRVAPRRASSSSISAVFVWRSFYGMRIPVEATSHTSAKQAVRP